ncbi:MAG: zf-HC2 domain-containing protein, partial [Chloroflexi bacterium]|nr:zf-HC2 domain-containing protein [Chloroflexota bacterium]
MTDTRHPRHDCPDLEEIAAYLDNRLTQPERGAVEAHLVSCEPCYELFAEAVGTLALMPVPAVAPGGRSFAPPRWLYGAFAVAAAVMVVVWVRPYGDPLRDLNRHVQTVVTAGAERPFEVRLTGEDRWRKAAAAMRGESRLKSLPADATIAMGELLRAVESGRTGPRLAALGRAQLAAGRVDEGLAALEESRALGGATAAVLSDLAAGYIVRAQAPERAGDLARALDALDQALSLDNGRPEAMFNRAIVLERLSLRAEAITAWEQYLAKDPDSGWAGEARDRLAALTQAEPRSDAGVGREHLLTCFLPLWAEGVLNGRDPEPGLADARLLVQALGDSSDTYAGDVVERFAALASDRKAFERALHAVVAYGVGRAHYVLDRHELAETSLAGVEMELQRLGHPLSLAATLDRGLVAYRQRDYERAHARLELLVGAGSGLAYPSISGRAHWTRGLMWLLEGRPRDSKASYLAAIKDLKAAGNEADAAFVTGLLATSYERLGDPVRMWQARLAALRGSSRDGTLLRAAAEARREGWHWAAREFAASAARSARKSGRAVFVADALRLQAVIESELGNPVRATALLVEARTLRDSLGDADAARERLSAEIDHASAQISVASGNPETGIEAASRALQYFSSGKVPANDRLPEILLTRARLGRRVGATERARTDLAHGLAIYGRMRQFANPGVD